ncbi:MAG: hypothetical protein KF723_10940 [Rhizobiaceae bacterium]|nr:hypothetical protein [Rhizobiaceae bacterium]
MSKFGLLVSSRIAVVRQFSLLEGRKSVTVEGSANPLFARSLARNGDLHLTGDCLTVTPLFHVCRSIFLELNAVDHRYRAAYRIRPICLAEDETDHRTYIGHFESSRGRTVAHFEQGRFSQILDQLIEDEVMPLLRSTETLPGYYEWALRRSRLAVDPAEHFLLEVAMGNLDAALMLMRWHRGKRFDCERTTGGFLPRNDAQVSEICRFVTARDWQAIASNFRAAETAWAHRHGLENIWRPKPFPFETRGT